MGAVAVLATGASKTPLLKLDWEEVNWPNLCLPSNSRGQFPPLGLRALVDKDLLHSSIHAAALMSDAAPASRGRSLPAKIYIRGGR